MTITNTTNKAVATGNGATTVWPYTFIIPELGDLQVTLVDVASGNETIIAPVNYTVTGLNNPAGGTVTYPLIGSPLTSATDIVLQRLLTETQETDLQNQGAVYPADIEDALDYLTMLVQQLQDQINRSIVFSIADTVETTLPVASARANLLLGFNSSGDPVAVSGITPGTTVSAAMIPVVTAPTTAAALTALGLPGALLDLLIPAGTVWDYSLTAAPTGFLFPSGQACTSLYPIYRAALVAASSPYGTNGVDPLMPDLRSMVVAGKSNMNGIDNTLLTGGTVLGALLGNQVVVLTTPQIPAHTHVITDPGHVHEERMSAAGGVSQIVTANGSGVLSGSGINTALSTTGITINNAGGGGSHPNVQPTFILNKIIKVH